VGALLFYDLTDEESYRNTTEWLKEINEHTEEGIIIMLIGNKIDLVQEKPSDRKIKLEEVNAFCKKYNLLYSETSAKNGDNIKESFDELIESKRYFRIKHTLVMVI
jgi:GTPase SAR1 family protein